MLIQWFAIYDGVRKVEWARGQNDLNFKNSLIYKIRHYMYKNNFFGVILLKHTQFWWISIYLTTLLYVYTNISVSCEWLWHGIINETNYSIWLQEHRLQEAAGVLVLDLGPPATGRLPRNHAGVRRGLHGCHLLQGSDQSYINPWKMICILVKKKSFYRCYCI